MRNINNIIDYINEDNLITEKIYFELVLMLQDSYKKYPLGCNVIAIFFMDLLKLLTQVALKERELKNEIVMAQLLNSELKSWPYFGYKDIHSGFSYKDKFFGKDTSVGFSNGKALNKKSIYIIFSNYLKKIYGKNSINILMCGSSALSNKRDIDILTGKCNLHVFDTKHPWFFLPELNDQLSYMRNSLKELLPLHIKSEFTIQSIINIFSNHISCSLDTKNKNPEINADYILLGSGVELNNRMLGSLAKQQNIPVINIMHGGAFGVQDEPVFGIYGEQLFSNKILGYGRAVIDQTDSYKFINNHINGYIPSNAGHISNLYKGPEVKVRHKINNYYYFPTSLRGSKHRYGPYQDLPDKLYLQWQEIISSIFQNGYSTKLHPKEKYSYLYGDQLVNPINGTFEKTQGEVDIFVFDYIGSAFFQACATDKPIIYFDLGIRNIGVDAMEKIKDRVIYYNLKTDSLPSLSDIEERLASEEKINNFTENYSLIDSDKTRSESLIDALVK
jgi:hypothetical protein